MMANEYSIDAHQSIAAITGEERRGDVRSLVGPYDLATLVQSTDAADGQTVDAFLYEIGEPELRHVTKVGGLPYWPSDSPWPTCLGPDKPKNARFFPPKGTPAVFLGQICFGNSKDITGELPSDVLLLFVEDETFLRVHFEWQPLGITNLIHTKDVPNPSFEFGTCFGHRVRIPDPASNEKARRIAATKIGGEPQLIQSPRNAGGKFLCQLSSFQPTLECPFPFVDHPEPITLDDDEWNCQLSMVDMGNLYIYLNENGECEYSFDSY
jgi:hypothetical protein